MYRIAFRDWMAGSPLWKCEPETKLVRGRIARQNRQIRREIKSRMRVQGESAMKNHTSYL